MKASTTTSRGGRSLAYREWTAPEVNGGDGYGAGIDSDDVRGVDIDDESLRRWTSPMVEPGFAVAELVPSWSARTPGSTRIIVEARGVTAAGALTRWYDLGHWSEQERTSITGQGDQDGRVDTDTLIAAADGWTAAQLRITLVRPPGSAETPLLLRAGLLLSGITVGVPEGEPPGPGCGVVLDVPAYAQFRHADHGGRGWCSPASIAMVLDFWGVGPGPEELGEWPADHPDPQVDHAATRVHDPAYGYGNWSFNVAHAARRGLVAFVTRLRSLAEAEQFIAVGMPLILSSNGHVVVLAGFTGDGDPVLNDPAANTNAGVRRVVGRSDFERAWLSTSRGICYVLHPPAAERPNRSDAESSW
ncbi:membrane protein [Actinoplanes cyaneus]|uniref:Membrane protein n=1 Tax=Actinoplanes cyaneus TaxID=52696 RepID=A0A919M5K2_9ACTN|nr:C39 family peptidase [Actinoplanes cyaneus]MCW2142496.1 Peptidase_C39 like family protein [Actinoplanes cyaneus]GID65303.1 membrane protein [Actinoplanes cyaneus]